ncbi:uncharacterized protein UDID_18180 [Ustilago sp. UG-2017a]|nr:uncharacterized protein UDID_18180 [Ustilago sp. UG-2017a]
MSEPLSGTRLDRGMIETGRQRPFNSVDVVPWPDSTFSSTTGAKKLPMQLRMLILYDGHGQHAELSDITRSEPSSPRSLVAVYCMTISHQPCHWSNNRFVLVVDIIIVQKTMFVLPLAVRQRRSPKKVFVRCKRRRNRNMFLFLFRRVSIVVKVRLLRAACIGDADQPISSVDPRPILHNGILDNPADTGFFGERTRMMTTRDKASLQPRICCQDDKFVVPLTNSFLYGRVNKHQS